MISSRMSPHTVSPQSTADLALGLFSNLYDPAPSMPGNLCPCPGYVGLQQGLSVWFLFHSACHRSASALSNSFKCSSTVPNNFPDVGIDPCLRFLTPWVEVRLFMLLFFPFFLHPTEFCVDLCIPFKIIILNFTFKSITQLELFFM